MKTPVWLARIIVNTYLGLRWAWGQVVCGTGFHKLKQRGWMHSPGISTYRRPILICQYCNKRTVGW